MSKDLPIQSWWLDLANHKLVREDFTAKQLAPLVKKSPATVSTVMASSTFKAFMAEEAKRIANVPAANEAIAGITGGLKFSKSKGALLNLARDVVWATLSDESLVPVVDKRSGEIVDHIPAVSQIEKGKLAVEVIKAFNQKSAQFIGKQVNVNNDNRQVTVYDTLDPALQELADSVIKSIPMRERKLLDGSVEVIAEVSAGEEEVGEEGGKEEWKG